MEENNRPVGKTRDIWGKKTNTWEIIEMDTVKQMEMKEKERLPLEDRENFFQPNSAERI